MARSLTDSAQPVLVRVDDAEYLESIGHYLLADSSATGGALSSHRIALTRGADGAVPHRHDSSSELFYILDGALDVLVGDGVLTAAAGDLLVVPPVRRRAPRRLAGHAGPIRYAFPDRPSVATGALLSAAGIRRRGAPGIAVLSTD
jgi:mannose-6-phosphate isomerase-like protein (cupin superfamily)